MTGGCAPHEQPRIDGAGEDVTLVATYIAYADDVSSLQVMDPSEDPVSIINAEIDAFKSEFDGQQMQLDCIWLPVNSMH